MDDSFNDLTYWRAYLLDMGPRPLNNNYTGTVLDNPLESNTDLNYWRAYLAKI